MSSFSTRPSLTPAFSLLRVTPPCDRRSGPDADAAFELRSIQACRREACGVHKFLNEGMKNSGL
eukprot:6099841-Pyramimonas_sp.AAC.1